MTANKTPGEQAYAAIVASHPSPPPFVNLPSVLQYVLEADGAEPSDWARERVAEWLVNREESGE